MFNVLHFGDGRMAKSTKNRGRNRFFNCCRPVNFNDDTIIKRGHAYKSKDPSLKRVKSQEKLDSMLNKDFTKNIRQSRKGNVFCRSFSDALKYVLSETSLGKKSQKKEPKYSFGSNKKLSLKLEKIFYTMNESRSSSKNFSNIDGNSRISSDDSSLFTSSTSTSSSPSSSCASSRSTLQKKQFPSFHKSKSVNNMQVYDNIKEKEIALRYNKNVGTYSLLICLLVMIFCGKVFAIVCTSTWLYFAPRCFKRIDSEEYKRNVIVEGFFERSHNCSTKKYICPTPI
ncbi:uncharacterized protein LOC107789926 [Nicotiana tabacum]|uniref:Uncharacterized protein LOC107789926 n=2 Tax=Nicotiana TaxID=4085 RepID=A0A1S3ZSA8_TOBAC|nr:PREDICTED: vitellogenin-2-like [Nicotiana sylvestris]XP_016467296.1 PREDICTED: vitellogenin-2-like [Nicotiana tabacum]